MSCAAEVIEAVRRWTDVAAKVGIEAERIERIEATHRLELPAE